MDADRFRDETGLFGQPRGRPMPISGLLAYDDDNASLYIKPPLVCGRFGFTGEAAPRCIVRSEFWSPALRGYKRVFDYKDDEELYDNLVHMLHLLYFR